MNTLKIFLSPFAYYARLNIEEFENHQKKGGLQKWFDNDKGTLPYEFVEFTSLDTNIFDFEFPEKVRKLGLVGSNVYCYHPFNHKTSVSSKIFEPMKIILKSDKEVHFLFDKGQSSSLHNHEKYYTKEGLPCIEKISFYIDDSTCNLLEKIKYSDNSTKTAHYHLISKFEYLQVPQWYSLFDFD